MTHYNTGSCNTGSCNTGDNNTGDRNTGNYNTGNYNTGNRNTGYYNTGSGNTGYFNNTDSTVRLFNIETDLSDSDSRLVNMRRVIADKIEPILVWVQAHDMTDEEKKDYPSYKTTGGYLKRRDYKYCWKKGWNNMTKEEKEIITSLPHFDPDVFEDITGIDVTVDRKKKVTLELTDKQLEKIKNIIKE